MNESNIPAPVVGVGNADEFNHPLALLKIEVGRDSPGLLPQLEAGRKVILITDQELAISLHPDALRRFGGMIWVCALHGAAVVFVNRDQVMQISDDELDGRVAPVSERILSS